jgi:antitoxin (DNA-binding transcriptional repressor) of toxin-antitoxin stability system
MTVSVEEAQTSLKQLIDKSAHGERVLITEGQQPIAELVSVQTTGNPVFGSCKGLLTIVSDDDEHLADFQEYMK